MQIIHRMSLIAVSAIAIGLVGCSHETTERAPSTAQSTNIATAQGAADVTPAALRGELKQAVRRELRDEAHRFGTNAWRDLDAIIDRGVDRLQEDGMRQQDVQLARRNVKRLAEEAATLAADNTFKNITRIQLMQALASVSPLYPYTERQIAPIVSPVPGQPALPPED